MWSLLLLLVTEDLSVSITSKQGLGISKMDLISLFKAIMLIKILYALPVYFGYFTKRQEYMLQSVA